MVDFAEAGTRPMVHEPMPILVKDKHLRNPDRPGDRGNLFNAVCGREKRTYVCAVTGKQFPNKQEAAAYVVETGNRVTFSAHVEIVRVCVDDPWQEWDDGAGVCWNDRFPNRGNAA